MGDCCELGIFLKEALVISIVLNKIYIARNDYLFEIWPASENNSRSSVLVTDIGKSISNYDGLNEIFILLGLLFNLVSTLCVPLSVFPVSDPHPCS